VYQRTMTKGGAQSISRMDASVGIGVAIEYRASVTRGNEPTLTDSEQDLAGHAPT